MLVLSLGSMAQKRPSRANAVPLAAPKVIARPPSFGLPEESPWSHLMDSLTAYLNKGPIATGILYDRAYPIAALHSFGVRRADTTSNAHIQQAHLELWMAAYNRNTFRYTPNGLREQADKLVRHDSIPLAVLDYQFNWLDTLALQDGLITLQQGRFYDAPSPSRSPYFLRNLTLAAPMVDTLRQLSTTFVLPNSLLLTNRSRQVTNVVVDFDNAGPNQFLVPGQAVSLTYPGSGPKVLWMTVLFNDGTSEQVRSALYVKAPVVNYRSIKAAYPNLNVLDARIPMQDYNTGTSLFGRGDVLVALHNMASQNEYLQGRLPKLRRPVIVLDGFDPGDASPVNDVYRLLESKGILTILDDQHLQRDLIILNFPKSGRISSNLAPTGGDVDGGADYIERNAMVLVELINRLKPYLDTDPLTTQPYQFTVIGPSMGGLVSRYALAYMEKQKLSNAAVPIGAAADYWDHNTEAWVSFDAPHEGAVVPMGDQAFMQFFAGVSASARETLDNTINSPAAKQMLVHHITAPGTTPAGAPGFRDRFMLALRDNGEPTSLGYPVHVRRVALADGQLNGQGDFGTPCGKMFDVSVHLRNRGAITIGLAMLGIPSGIAYSGLNCTARYAPGAGSTCPVFVGTATAQLFPFGSATYTQTRAVTSGTQGSFDLTPGGYRNTQTLVKEQAEGSAHGQPYQVDVTNVQPNHSFIPTYSGLGFQYQSMANYQNTSSLPNPYSYLLGRDLVCTDEIPFDSYFAQAAVNSEHVTVPFTALPFLLNELTPHRPPVFLSGPTAICPGRSAVFSVVNECPRLGQPAITYLWSVGPGLNIISGQGTSAVTVEAVSGITGSTTVQVVGTRPGFTNSIPLVFNVAVESGSLDIRVAPGNRPKKSVSSAAAAAPFNRPDATTYTCSETIHLLATSHNIAKPYSLAVTTFRPTGPSTRSYIVSDDEFDVIVHDNAIELVLSGNSVCNGSLVTSGPARFAGCNGRPAGPKAAAYPNPADTELNLAAPETGDATAPRTAILYNAQGREVRRNSQALETRLSTANLPEGIYYLMVNQQGQVTRSQIRVQH